VTAAFVPLSRLLAAGRAPDSPVALHAGRLTVWAELAGRVAGLARVLEAPPGTRWALFTDDAWAFAAGLLGIWHAGGIAVIPPNGQPGTLKEIAGAGVRGIVTDRFHAAVGVDVVHALQQVPATVPSWPVLDPAMPRLELFTSGTSGPARVSAKALAQIDGEVAAHERRWRTAVDGAQAIATVSHQHIYGLLFRIAWPLTAGRVFRSGTLLHPPEVAAAMGDAGTAYLVSTPAHLRRLAGSPSSLLRLAGSCRMIFSSGGPLDPLTAETLAGALGVAPTEIFGSTETGGVAWRQQRPGDGERWTPFDEVTIDCADDEQRLRVASSWSGGGFTMGDRARVDTDGRFVLGARTDRVVKIGEKRLALPEMEARLQEHPFVARVALVLVDHRGEPRLACAVVASAEGAAMLRRDGPRRLGMVLRRWLEPHWDHVLLPRAWRFVDELPEDAQGKTSAAALQALFR
jgi:acyl-coenzyme A synthetase/AMP-(fatty) acid ligase